MSYRAIPFVLVALLSLGLVFPSTAMAGEDSQPADTYRSGTTDDTYYQDDVDVDMPEPAWTVLNYSLSGAAIGGIVGTGIWLLSGRDLSLWIVPQFVGGGLLIGAGVGALVVLNQDREPVTARTIEAETPNSVKWIERDMPESFEVPVLRLNF